MCDISCEQLQTTPVLQLKEDETSSEEDSGNPTEKEEASQKEEKDTRSEADSFEQEEDDAASEAEEDATLVEPTTEQGRAGVDGNRSRDSRSRLRRSHRRSLSRKAIPRSQRYLLRYQQYYNYMDLGTKEATDIQDNTGKFAIPGGIHNGHGNQPYYTTRAEDYPGGTVATDYDSLIEALTADTTKQGYSEPKLAQICLDFIAAGTPIPVKGTQYYAIATLTAMTQLVEAHKTRIPGADKWARAALRRIASGNSTFDAEFNNTSGNFLPARSKGIGGQKLGRVAMGVPRGDDTKLNEDDIFSQGVTETLDYLSESSVEDTSTIPPVRPPIRNPDELPAKGRAKPIKRTTRDGDFDPDAEKKEAAAKKKRRLELKQKREEKKKADEKARKRAERQARKESKEKARKKAERQERKEAEERKQKDEKKKQTSSRRVTTSGRKMEEESSQEESKNKRSTTNYRNDSEESTEKKRTSRSKRNRNDSEESTEKKRTSRSKRNRNDSEESTEKKRTSRYKRNRDDSEKSKRKSGRRQGTDSEE